MHQSRVLAIERKRRRNHLVQNIRTIQSLLFYINSRKHTYIVLNYIRMSPAVELFIKLITYKKINVFFDVMLLVYK